MAHSKEEISARMKAYYKANKEKIAAKQKAYREANKEKLSAKQKAYREDNKEKLSAKKKLYHKANKEKITAYKKANKEKIAAQLKTWQAANKEKIAAYNKANKEKVAVRKKAYHKANREKINDNSKAYYQANKEKSVAHAARRRALKRKQIPIHLRDCPHEKQRLVKTYKLRNILSEATGVQHHVDHMWPLNDGGPHWSGNLQVIPAEENLSKHASVCEDTKATIIKSLYTFESDRAI